MAGVLVSEDNVAVFCPHMVQLTRELLSPIAKAYNISNE